MAFFWFTCEMGKKTEGEEEEGWRCQKKESTHTHTGEEAAQWWYIFFASL